MLGDEQYELSSRDGKCDHKVYFDKKPCATMESFPDPESEERDHDIIRPGPKAKSSPRSAQGKVQVESQSLHSDEKSVEADDTGSDEHVPAVIGPSVKSIKVEKPMKVGMNDFPPHVNVSPSTINLEGTENDGPKLHSGETRTGDVAMEQAKSVAAATEHLTKLENRVEV